MSEELAAEVKDLGKRLEAVEARMPANPYLEKAARWLADYAKDDANVQAVGVGNGELVVYVAGKAGFGGSIPAPQCMGFPVRIAVSGKIVVRPAK